MPGKINELKPKDLCNRCDCKKFKFKTTEDIKVREAAVYQDRAMQAIEFGLNMKSTGYNLYISGRTGTGRNTTIIREVSRLARKEEAPPDICYINNFDNEYEPRVLKLPPGTGRRFKEDMDELIHELESEIEKSFSGKEYEERKKELLDELKKKKEGLSRDLQDYAESKGFTIQQSLTGVTVIPVKNGKPMKDRQYAELSEDKKQELEGKREEVYERIHEYSRKLRDIQKKTKNAVDELDKKIAFFTMWLLIDDIKDKYKDFPRIPKHLDQVVDDIMDNLDYFKKTEEDVPSILAQDQNPQEPLLNKYRVNLLVDNSETEGAPVIIEDNPNYHNLIGKIEHRAQFGALLTDFTMIKPGAVHSANGGYLILQAKDLLKDYFAWDGLKKIIKNRNVKIENLYEKYGLVSTTSLKPEPVNVDLKVIIVGNPDIYHLLHIYDEDFRKLFKVKAAFDTTLERKASTINKYICFIASKCREDKLLPFNRQAVAEIIDFSSRRSDHKKKLSARFLDVEDVMRESDYWARKDKAKNVGQKHVAKALEQKEYRSNLIEKKIQELIEEKTIFMDVEGEKIGQINGLSIIDLGDYMFGKPSRITVKTFLGKGEVVNIEREIHMSGKIHSKGVLILTGYMGARFGQDKPLTFSSSICFEQLYDEVDGDSASSTELYCLLSSLAEVPIRQDIAVTGSVDQNGRVQPVGGINQKIEGFFEVCRMKGLTGQQGVIIPESNVKHLMLKDEVVASVEKGKFHIYPVKTVDQGIEILTGVKAGIRRKNGSFTKDSIGDMVNRKLEQYEKMAIKFIDERK